MAISIPYQLDILGSLQFENLVQELLIAQLGLGVEAWGGSSDRGIDAYSTSKLNFPNRQKPDEGPFVFQAKFIAGANATGAKFEKELLAAVRKEVELIKKRTEQKRWKNPKHYALFTNAPISASQREKTREILSGALPRTTVTIHGATAICVLIDLNTAIAKAFPQLLSLRNLHEVLRNVLRNRSMQRSEAVINEAEALTKVFVPTDAYDRAWRVLSKHHFVVLEGPPEMGKTAIAWMIAAVQLTQKWEGIDCDNPDDFFENYTHLEKQIFIADDAFGTTEYETARGSNWGRQLHKILPKLNSTHWLVWTSRMHILKLALLELSLQGKAAAFPKPAEVIVNAGTIDRRERALILYRHARAAGLDEIAKEIVRKYAASVIDNPHFTPERIRRFVNDELQSLRKKSLPRTSSDGELSRLVGKAIENPTDRMNKSYGKLDPRHKWLLIALLDCERSPEIPALEDAYRRFLTPNKPIEEEIQLLEEGFLQTSPGIESTSVDWIHPSYRDLVIQELQTDERMAGHFLEKCSKQGLLLAVSVAGGTTGEKRFPLMSSPTSWDILRKRSVSLIRESTNEYESWDILGMLQNAAESAGDDPAIYHQIISILSDCCEETKQRLDDLNQPLATFVLRRIYEASMLLTPPSPLPSLIVSWTEFETAFEKSLSAASEEYIDSSSVREWVFMLNLVSKCDQRLLIQSGFPSKMASRTNQLCAVLESELVDARSLNDADDYASEIVRLGELSTSLRELTEPFPKLDRKLKRLSKSLDRRVKELEKRQRELEPPAEFIESFSPDENRHKKSFDLDRLFAEL